MDRPRRILRVAQTCYPSVTGGGAYHVHAMSRDQAAMGHDVTVLTIRQDPEEPHVEERDGYTIVRFDATVSPLGNALSVGLARYLHERTAADAFDVVHAHSHLYAATNVAALVRRLGDVPLAITNHGLYSQTAPEWFVDGYLRTVGRWTFDQADLVFCYTAVDERRLRALGVSTPVAVVPNGVDEARFGPDGPTHDRLESDGPTVLFVGRLVEGKRPLDAVDAMERVRRTHPDATLYCCGDGPLRSAIDRRAATAADGSIECLGHVAYDEMPDVYRAADVLVLPSRAEGMPRTVLEARAADTPVVTTDLDHLSAVADDGVRTVPVGAVDRLAAAITAALDERPASDAVHDTLTDSPADRTSASSSSRSTSAARSGSVARRSDGSAARRTDEAAAQRTDGTTPQWTDGTAAQRTDGSTPLAQTTTQRAPPAGVDGSTPASTDSGRSNATTFDWESTVRETTRALEGLVDRAESS